MNAIIIGILLKGMINMARSKAQKQRQKLLREGRMDPSVKRSPFSQIDLDLRTRATKTKQEKQNQLKHRNQLSDYSGWDGSFLCFSSVLNTRIIS